jgi:hypothetical protein
MKELIEQKLREKDEQSSLLENEYKNEIKKKMEDMTMNAQKYLIENTDLKTHIINYRKGNEEMAEKLAIFNKEYETILNELEKVNNYL